MSPEAGLVVSAVGLVGRWSRRAFAWAFVVRSGQGFRLGMIAEAFGVIAALVAVADVVVVMAFGLVRAGPVGLAVQPSGSDRRRSVDSAGLYPAYSEHSLTPAVRRFVRAVAAAAEGLLAAAGLAVAVVAAVVAEPAAAGLVAEHAGLAAVVAEGRIAAQPVSEGAGPTEKLAEFYRRMDTREQLMP